jgi:hypothetical protein
MTVSVSRIQHYLKSFKLGKLFIEELGWDRHSGKLLIEVDGTSYTLSAIAEKRGVQIFTCSPSAGGITPDYATRRKIEKQVTKSAYEHLIIFIENDNSMQIWQWVSRQPGLRAAYREHHYHPKYHIGESLVQKLMSITFALSEEEGLTLTGVAFKLRDAFDRDKITKKFYDYFKRQHAKFLDFIQGITQQGNREWYASLMLNRLMFVYFIQRKGFLDGDSDYLKNHLKMVQDRKGKGKFLSFYRYFLLRLFHEGFSQQPKQRKKDLEDLLGKVPYLNGGLFELHELEREYPKIDIPDEAFEKLFAFFDQYEWHLDNRPLSNDNEINPDVLGYIFEKYINQKQMGAYYTKEDITEYISKNTVIPYLFNATRKKCAVAFQKDSSLWGLLENAPLRYIYPAVTKGVIDANGDVIPLPTEIAKGIDDVSIRDDWNEPADTKYALPTETWREHVTRRQRCIDIIDKLTRGKICQINDLITYNLDIRQFAEDAITECEGPELLRAFYQAISMVTVLDPTCGSGAFLFAALNILEPLYDACLDRMQGFVDDLERSGERYRPEKYSDFRNILKEVDRHPNRRFFVLKSIVVNNLYGVDIMEEAVEICKLRLFLKLVAQVDRVKQLEPLPDIDFNIRAGNTLVGFVSVDEIRKAAEYDTRGQRQIILSNTKKEIKQIEEDAEIVDLAFKRFHEMQIEQEMDARDFKAAKEELRDRLKQLAGNLNRYLAKEYGINPEKKKLFIDWRISHQPFHWFIDFYGIMSRGGFDVIIGNPPYVETRKVESYAVINYSTQKCRDLYAYVLERSLNLANINGHLSFIIPMSCFSVDRFGTLQKFFLQMCRNIYISHWSGDAHPSKLFEGVDKRLEIMIANRNDKKNYKPVVYTSKYLKWYSSERPQLFKLNPKYHKIADLKELVFFSHSLVKIGTSIEEDIIAKLKACKLKIADLLNTVSNHKLFYTRKVSFFLQFLDFVPEVRDSQGNLRDPSELKILSFIDNKRRDLTLGALSTSLFYWFNIINSDCRNLNKREVVSFPVPSQIDIKANSQISDILSSLMLSYQKNSETRTVNYKNKGNVTVQYFDFRKSKYIIDKIDEILSFYYKLSAEEVDFIVNFDIKYRMGTSLQ